MRPCVHSQLGPGQRGGRRRALAARAHPRVHLPCTLLVSHNQRRPALFCTHPLVHLPVLPCLATCTTAIPHWLHSHDHGGSWLLTLGLVAPMVRTGHPLQPLVDSRLLLLLLRFLFCLSAIVPPADPMR